MRSANIELGGRYAARISGHATTLRVLDVCIEDQNWQSGRTRKRTYWLCLNERSGRRLVVRSAQRFRYVVAQLGKENQK